MIYQHLLSTCSVYCHKVLQQVEPGFENSSVTLNGDIVDNSSVSAGDYKFTYTINANACPTVFTLTIKIEGGIVLACGTVLVT
jgi:hypothetical protein